MIAKTNNGNRDIKSIIFIKLDMSFFSHDTEYDIHFYLSNHSNYTCICIYREKSLRKIKHANTIACIHISWIWSYLDKKSCFSKCCRYNFLSIYIMIEFSCFLLDFKSKLLIVPEIRRQNSVLKCNKAGQTFRFWSKTRSRLEFQKIYKQHVDFPVGNSASVDVFLLLNSFDGQNSGQLLARSKYIDISLKYQEEMVSHSLLLCMFSVVKIKNLLDLSQVQYRRHNNE